MTNATIFLSLLLMSQMALKPGLAQAQSRPVPETQVQPQTAACRDFEDFTKNQMRTHGLVVLKNGEKQMEFYGNGADEKSLYKMWSVSKTFTSVLLGAAIAQKKLDLETPLRKIMPLGPTDQDWPDANRRYMNLRHVFSMASGLSWCEDTKCDATPPLKALYGSERKDVLDYVLRQPLTDKPGMVYRYSSGNAIIMMAAMKKVMSPEEYSKLPETVLGPLGIADWHFEKDGQGVYMGGSGLYLSTSSMAKLGQLILNRGQWKDGDKTTEIFTPEFYRQMITPSVAIRSNFTDAATKAKEGPSGGGVWLNRKMSNVPQFLPQAPEDLIYTNGKQGQFLLVIPSAGLVISRNGADENFDDLLSPFTTKALKCFAPQSLQRGAPAGKVDDRDTNLIAMLGTLKTVKDDNLVANYLALELCNCQHISKMKTEKACEDIFRESQVDQYYDWKVRRIPEQHKVIVNATFKGVGVPILNTLVGAGEKSTAVAVYDINDAHGACSLQVRGSNTSSTSPNLAK